MHRTPSSILLAAVLGLVLELAACSSGPRAVRGSDEPGLDYHAMSTGLDKRDLQQMLNANMNALRVSPVRIRWTEEYQKYGAERRPAVAVLPIQNQTSEHIDSALDALISDVETQLIDWGGVKVVSLERQPDLIQQVRQQQNSGVFDQNQVAALGKQVGVRYVITGKVYTTDERVEDQRRVQYYLFTQVLDVETGEIVFQKKTSETKAMIRD